MARLIYTGLMVLVFAVSGCENQYAKNKKAALARWSKARAQVTTNIARQQFRTGQLKKAARNADNAIKIDNKYIPAYVLLGRINLEQNLLLPARKCFEKSLEIDSNNDQSLYYMGLICEKRGQYVQAEDFYRKAWQVKPENNPYVLALAELLASNGKQEEALGLLKQQMKQYDADTAVYSVAGDILVSMGRNEEAIKMFQNASRLQPDNRTVMESLAMALCNTGQYQQALDLFEQLQTMKQQPKDVSWSDYIAMGDCYLNLGRYHQAQRCYEKVVDSDNNIANDSMNYVAMLRLAQTSLARNNNEAARNYANNVLRIKPGSTDALMVLGYVALKEHKYRQALNVFSDVVSRDKNNGLGWCLLGQSFQSLGNNKQAAKCYNRALQVDPDDSLAKSMSKKLACKKG